MTAKLTDGVIVCVLVLVLDTTAGILAIMAQAARNKVACDEPVYTAYRLGGAATGLLLAADISANFFCNCDLICPQLKFIRASLNRRLSTAARLLSMIMLLVGTAMLLLGAVSSARTSKATPSCGFVHGHAMVIGGVMCFVHGGIIIAYYVAAIVSYRKNEVRQGLDP